jgi:hypothetical protein
VAVVRDLKVSEELHATSLLRKAVIGGKRNGEVVSHATDIDDGVVRIRFNEESADESDHGREKGKGSSVAESWLK